MPSKNVKKHDIAKSYYHVYARGASKLPIFLEHADYQYFMGLFVRYLSIEPKRDKSDVIYPHYRGDIELLVFCLMENHFHLLLYQSKQGDMSRFMKSIMTSYGRYFNLKYKRSGSLYESTYKASLIDADNYLLHISRYIHLNPRYWLRYKYSSISNYLGNRQDEWLTKERVTRRFSDPKDYKEFLEDYEQQKDILDEIKYELADQ